MPQKGQSPSFDKQKFLNSYPVPRLSNELFLMSEIQKIMQMQGKSVNRKMPELRAERR